MGQGLNDFLLKMSPAYDKGFEDGFRAAQRACIRRMEALLNEAKKLEAFSLATGTAGKEDPIGLPAQAGGDNK